MMPNLLGLFCAGFNGLGVPDSLRWGIALVRKGGRCVVVARGTTEGTRSRSPMVASSPWSRDRVMTSASAA